MKCPKYKAEIDKIKGECYFKSTFEIDVKSHKGKVNLLNMEENYCKCPKCENLFSIADLDFLVDWRE